MCTQEIIWCSCGHGEFLPIIKCPQAESTGACYTVVHGDHRVVLPMKCSYCISGLFDGAALGTKARPEGELAAVIERKSEGQVGGDAGALEDAAVANSAGDLPLELGDVVNTDWSDFNIDPELWQYV